MTMEQLEMLMQKINLSWKGELEVINSRYTAKI